MEIEESEQKKIETNYRVEPQTPLSENEQQNLINEAKQFNQLYTEFQQKNFDQDENMEYYLISQKWLDNWKIYVSYEEVINSQQPSPYLGGKQPEEKLNSDLIEKDPKFKQLMLYGKDGSYQDVEIPFNHWNKILKTQIQESLDYLIVDQAIYDFFEIKYETIKIVRYAHKTNNTKKIEIQPKKLNVFITCANYLKNIDLKHRTTFVQGNIYISHFMTIKQLQNLLQHEFMKYKDYNLVSKQLEGSNFIRIWKMNSKWNNLQEYFKELQKKCNESKSYEYKITIEADILNNSDESLGKIIEDCEILPEDMINIEIKEWQKSWIFRNSQVPWEEKCEYCQTFQVLKYPCSCQKVAYCTESCQAKDKQYHQPKCANAGKQEEQEANELQLQENSRNGLVGLRNLGNTCFMNSGLQCLQNCKELTEYFLNNQYENEINETNVLGTKGKLARAYATLIKHMYYGSQTDVSPFGFKRILGEFQHIFSGYSQNDSQELVNFALDGLHEDLNLIKVKTATEQNDDDGPQQYWEKFKLRNTSIIQKLMYGQFKSQINCPDCPKVSVAYDPFLMISLPIPQNTMEKISVQVEDGLKQRIVELQFDEAKPHTLQDLALDLAAKLNLENPGLLNFILSSDYQIDSISMKTNSADIKRKLTFKTLIAQMYSQQEIQIPKSNQYEIQLAHKKYVKSYYQTSSFKSFTQLRSQVFSSQQTLKSVHLQLFEKYFDLIQLPENYDQNLSQEQLYEEYVVQNKDEKTKLWEIKIDNGGGYSWKECNFCDVKNCQDCPFPYTDVLLEDLIDKASKGTMDQDLKLEICWINIKQKYQDSSKDDFFKLYSKDLEEQQNNKMEEEEKTEETNEKTQDESENNKNNIEDKQDEFGGEKQKPVQNGNSENQNSQNYNPFGRKSQISLEDCLKKSAEAEILGHDNEWYCNQCKDHKQAKKQVQIYKAPKIMIIHFKRFKSGMTIYKSKISEIVDFPLSGLCMDEFILDNNLPDSEQFFEKNEQVRNGNVLYDLFGVSNHYGSMSFGHYTAYCKNFMNGKWYYFDDSKVTEENNLSNIVSEASYMLFYRRRDDDDDDQNQELEVQQQQEQKKTDTN